MKATSLVLLCGLATCLSTAQAQSARQTITIVVVPTNTMTAQKNVVNLARIDGLDELDGEANYSFAASEPAKITAQVKPGTPASEGLWATAGFLTEPTRLGENPHELANGIPATLGDSLHIRYGLDAPRSAEKGSGGDSSTVVVLTLTN